MKPSDRDVTIWDLPTRIFHWSLVLLVAGNLFLIGPQGGLHTIVHFVTGYTVAGLLLFRLAWGFVGSPRSRFADFLRRWPVVKSYIGRLKRFDPPHSIGHNPLGGWMIALLLATLGGMIATGLFAAGRRAAGPLAGLIPLRASALAGDLHQLISNILIALIAAHLAGVAADWFLTGDNLVKSMLTGRKRLPAEAAAREGSMAPAWRAVLLALVSLAVVAGLSLSTDYTRSRGTLAQDRGGSNQAGP
jgi:cytochrome b